MTPEQAQGVILYDGKPVFGFGQGALVAPAAAAATHSPWAVALATSVVGAATGWVIEEFARHVRGMDRS